MALGRGVVFWSGFGTTVVALTVLAGRLLGMLFGRPEKSRWLSRPVVALASLFLALIAVETVLALIQRPALEPGRFEAPGSLAPAGELLPLDVLEKVERMQAQRILPLEWNKRKVRHLRRPEDRHTPYMWHGALHLFDEHAMRRPVGFAPKDPKRFRIAVVGDSLTYGQGIPAEWSYPAQLEHSLSAFFDVECLNLGVCGYQTEEIVEVIERFVPELEPDLVVYGVCINDLLPRGKGETKQYAFPIPNGIKRLMINRTRIGPACQFLYGKWLERRGLRHDFYEQLLADLDQSLARFGRDVSRMNAFVTALGLPPIVATVLDQLPRKDGPGHELALAIERELAIAGLDVVPAEAYYQNFDGRDLRVSRWEGHPNELAHALFAERLHVALAVREDLADFAR